SVALHLALPAIALAAPWPSTVHAQAASADPRAVTFDIPAGPLSTALGAFGVQAGVMVASDPALTANARTRGVSGTQSVDTALSELLAGTGLQAVGRAGGGYRLQAAPAAGQAATLAPVTVTGSYNP